jgi:hypothetical protein
MSAAKCANSQVFQKVKSITLSIQDKILPNTLTIPENILDYSHWRVTVTSKWHNLLNKRLNFQSYTFRISLDFLAASAIWYWRWSPLSPHLFKPYSVFPYQKYKAICRLMFWSWMWGFGLSYAVNPVTPKLVHLSST